MYMHITGFNNSGPESHTAIQYSNTTSGFYCNVTWFSTLVGLSSIYPVYCDWWILRQGTPAVIYFSSLPHHPSGLQLLCISFQCLARWADVPLFRRYLLVQRCLESMPLSFPTPSIMTVCCYSRFKVQGSRLLYFVSRRRNLSWTHRLAAVHTTQNTQYAPPPPINK